ncbi:MAG: hypothetical protein WC887_02250 [Candidatus Paceibacterota bacterium]|jgi:hypothetical protein
MSFLNLFRDTKKSQSVVLIDVTADSVAGAYALYKESETPTLLYTRRLPLDIREGEPCEQAMVRALTILGNELIREGAPILMRATGNGHADTVLVSVDTPWQETKVRTENFEREKPFMFTKTIVATAIEKTSIVPTGKFLADESIVSTILNGYETHDPYGKHTRRASVTVITSFIEKIIFDTIVSILRDLFHTKHIFIIASGSLRYQAIRAAFPHERRPDTSSLVQALEAANTKKLWIPGLPPKIVPVLAGHIAGAVRQTTTTPPDLHLLLMALYYSRHASE